MKNKKIPFYYLKSCDKCVKILKSLPIEKLEVHNIKENPLSEQQIDGLKKLMGSYRELFNFRAQKLKEMDQKPETEAEFRDLLLQDYTFMKRPLAVLPDKIITGDKPEQFSALKDL